MQERNVKGRNFVFIGGSHGMGRAAAMELAARGAAVLIVSRGKQAGEAAAAQAKTAGSPSADYLPADLSTVEGMGAAADGIIAWKGEIHGLMHTAMAAFSKRIVTSDGLDFAFALQYLARASLNRLLIDRLAASGTAASFNSPAMSVRRWPRLTSTICSLNTENGLSSHRFSAPITWDSCTCRRRQRAGPNSRYRSRPAALNRSKQKSCRIRKCHLSCA